MMNNFPIALGKKVPNQIAFPVILIFGLVMTLIILRIGNKVIADFPESATIKNIEKYNLPEEKTPPVKINSKLK